MLRPAISPWVEEPCEFAAGCDRADIAALGPIAARASVRQILRRRGAAVFLADHVIDLASQVRVALMNQAVLADTTGTRLDFPA